MKLIVCGKGGSGKSTVSTLLAKGLAQQSRRVLLVDVDESNIGLYRMLGLEMPVPLMDHFGGKKGFQERIKSAGIGLGGSVPLFPEQMTFDRLPDECVSTTDGIHAVSVGKIHHFGEGCACPMGRLFRMLFASLILETRDCIVVDTSAGVEHFGRSLDSQCDHAVCVVDPSFESVNLAGNVKAFTEEIRMPVSFVLNKVQPEIEADLSAALGNIPIAAKLAEDRDIFLNTLKGDALTHDGSVMDGLISLVCAEK